MKLTGKLLQQRATEVYGPHAKVVKWRYNLRRHYRWDLIVGGVCLSSRNSRKELMSYMDGKACELAG